jgi:ornithine cyclodeaminase/alanine dehydrogenase-like protein (mu-crystallin family)
MQEAIEAVELGLKDQAAGALMMPQRHNLRFGEQGKDGFLRIGPCALLDAGWMGFKAMNLAKGHGVRYQIHLYEMATGELKAIMDAKHITTLRTGATSAIATKHLANPGKMSVGIIGSGNESWAQIAAMAAIDVVHDVKVYSPTEANRNLYAQRCMDELGIAEARGVATPDEAVDGAGLLIAAVNSDKHVLFGKQLTPGMHVNSVGTARPVLREIDEEVFARADIVVVDTREGVFQEAGDAILAVEAGAIKPEDAYETHQLISGEVPKRDSEDQITLFKSVGTALQDIATAVRVYKNAAENNIGQELDDFPYLLEKKPSKKYV